MNDPEFQGNETGKFEDPRDNFYNHNKLCTKFFSNPFSTLIEHDFESNIIFFENRLKDLFLENIKLTNTPRWKIAQYNLTEEIKNCIVHKLFIHYEVKSNDVKNIEYAGNTYDLLSDRIINAPARYLV